MWYRIRDAYERMTQVAAHTLAELVGVDQRRCVLILRPGESWLDAALRAPPVAAWLATLPEAPRLDNSFLPGACVTCEEAAAIARFRANQAREQGAEVVFPV